MAIIILLMSISCEKHEREALIYDLDLNHTICERCALFEPFYKGHSFIEVAQLGRHSQQLYLNFTSKLASLQIQTEGKQITSQTIKKASNRKIAEEIAVINEDCDCKIKEIEKERAANIQQIEQQIKGMVDDSKKSIKTLISDQYLRLLNSSQTLRELFEQKDHKELTKMLSNPSLTSSISLIEKDIEMINIQFTNKLAYVNHEAPYFLQLCKKQSIKEENLMNNIENEFIGMFDSLKDSRVSTKSNCKTQISFGSFNNNSEQELAQTTRKMGEALNESSASIQNSLKTLKVFNKSEIKNLYIKNGIKVITLTQLDLNNREAIDAIKKCSFNNFVSKIDLSHNQITHKFISQLKKEKVQSKYLKKIVVKGIKSIDTRELKKEGIVINQTPTGLNVINIGDITIQY